MRDSSVRVFSRISSFLLPLVAALLLGTAAAQAESDTWKAIGPSGGTVTALAVDGGVAGVIYAGTDFGGVWKSVDGAASWAASGEGMSDGSITSLAVAPAHSNVVYAATASSGVFKSEDGGASWSAASQGLPAGKAVTALALDPAADGTLWVSTADTGVFLSTDGAASWTLKKPKVNGLEVNAILVDAGTVFLGTVGAGTEGNYILASADGGATWTASTTPGLSSPVTSLAFDPIAPATLYAGTFSEGVFKSVDHGARWAPTGAMVNPGVTALATDPVRSGFVFAATQPTYSGGTFRSGGVFKSVDGGATWQRQGQGMPIVSTRFGSVNTTFSVAVDPAARGVVYAGNAVTGVFKSLDRAAHWSPAVNGLRAQAMVRVAVDPRRPGTIYAGSAGTGLYRSRDGGATWVQLIADANVASILIDPLRTLTVYVGADAGFFRTSDGGDTWTESHPGTYVYDFTGALAMDPTQRSTFYAGTFDGVYKSVDSGATWTPPANTHRLPCLQPLTLAVDPRTPSDVYVGGTDTDAGCSVIYPNVVLDRSLDGGRHWTEIADGRGDFDWLVIDPRTPTFYAALGGGLSTSVDGGLTWQETSLDHRDHQIETVVLDPATAGSVYAGDFYSGLFWSPDGGATWSRLADPLTRRNVAGVAPAPTSRDVVYAATSGGLFQVARQTSN